MYFFSIELISVFIPHIQYNHCASLLFDGLGLLFGHNLNAVLVRHGARDNVEDGGRQRRGKQRRQRCSLRESHHSYHIITKSYMCYALGKFKD
jgi:hypothetical protein